MTVVLKRLAVTDVTDKYMAVLTDPEVMKYTTVVIPPTPDEQRQYVAEHPCAFAVRVEKSGHFVGTVTLNHIDWTSGHADIGMLLGQGAYFGTDRQYDTAEIAQEVIEKVVAFAFGVLNLRRVYLGALEGQEERIAAVQAAGFTEEGRWREHSWVEDHYEDEIWFGLLRK